MNGLEEMTWDRFQHLRSSAWPVITGVWEFSISPAPPAAANALSCLQAAGLYAL